MTSNNVNNFWGWFDQVREGLTILEIERQGGGKRGRISNHYRKSAPTALVCKTIARGLGISEREVLERAGLLPSEPEPVRDEDDLLNVYRQLAPQQRRFLLDSARGLQGQLRPVNPPIITQISPIPPPAEIVIPDRDESTVPEPEEMIILLKMLDEPERYFVYDYILWRLQDQQRRRNSSGQRTEQERRQEYGEAIDIINLMLAVNEAEPWAIEQVIERLQKIQSDRQEKMAVRPAETTSTR